MSDSTIVIDEDTMTRIRQLVASYLGPSAGVPGWTNAQVAFYALGIASGYMEAHPAGGI